MDDPGPIRPADRPVPGERLVVDVASAESQGDLHAVHADDVGSVGSGGGDAGGLGEGVERAGGVGEELLPAGEVAVPKLEEAAAVVASSEGAGLGDDGVAVEGVCAWGGRGGDSWGGEGEQEEEAEETWSEYG